jgi:hypothetical protein
VNVYRVWEKPFQDKGIAGYPGRRLPGFWCWEVHGAGFVTGADTRARALKQWRESRQARRKWARDDTIQIDSA